MARPFNRLRMVMRRLGVSQCDLAEVLRCTSQAVSNKFCNKSQWTLSECYMVMDYLGIDSGEIGRYFTPNGRNE